LPDQAGLVYWGELLKSGANNLEQISDGFVESAEFEAALTGKSSSDIVRHMYENTLDRPADPVGLAYWTSLLDRGATYGQILLGFSESAEHYALIASHMTGGIEYIGA
jgi:hypothetical protein